MSFDEVIGQQFGKGVTPCAWLCSTASQNGLLGKPSCVSFEPCKDLVGGLIAPLIACRYAGSGVALAGRIPEVESTLMM